MTEKKSEIERTRKKETTTDRQAHRQAERLRVAEMHSEDSYFKSQLHGQKIMLQTGRIKLGLGLSYL